MDIKFDQHFLDNNKILQTEIEISNIKENDIILEIGAGDGRLTRLILENKPNKLISIEIDSSLEEQLRKIKEKFSNFDYIIGNGLEEIKNHKFTKIISNIPYSITEPLYNFILDNKIEYIVLLHGEKFYNQILSKESKWYYFVNAFYNMKLIEEVDGKEFKPNAKVKSVLIKLELKNENELTKKEIFFQSLFERKDRNTKNAIIYSLVEIGITKKESKKIIEKLNLNELTINMKFENISNKSFEYIIDNLSDKLKMEK